MKFLQARDGRRLAYADSGGAGPCVLCLAGLTRNVRDFSDLTDRLYPRYRVIRLDSRGRGQSEHAVDPLAEYAVPVEAEDALDLINHLGLVKVALIGTSRGGILSMALAASNKGRIPAIVLNDVGAVVEGRGLLRIMATLGRPPRGETFSESALALRDMNAQQFPGISLEEWEHHAYQLYDSDNGRPVLAYDTHLRSAVASAIDVADPGVSLWPLFEALNETKILVIRGENSDILTRETLDQMQARHPDLVAVTLLNRGHAPFLNEPAALDAIELFLETHMSVPHNAVGRFATESQR